MKVEKGGFLQIMLYQKHRPRLEKIHLSQSDNVLQVFYGWSCVRRQF